MPPAPPNPSTNPQVLRTLYRSLLRSSTPFSSPVLSSLLHRSGITHDWEECVHRLRRGRSRVASARVDADDGGEETFSLPKEWAMNLSRSYVDLREEYSVRREYFLRHPRNGDDDDDDGDASENESSSEDDEEFLHATMGSSNYRTSARERREMQRSGYDDDEVYTGVEDPRSVLFRHLFREWIVDVDVRGGDGENRKWSMDEDGIIEHGKLRQIPYMRWPCQITNGKGLRDLIRREFRAPTVEERCSLEAEANEEDKDSSTSTRRYFPPSSYIDDSIRIRTAFYALMELNRKLAWADKIGLASHVPLQMKHATTNDEESSIMRNRRRLLQAAKGVLPFPRPSTNITDQSNNDSTSTSTYNYPLQCGTYLIAHPLMTGYFAKSVIILLDHTASPEESSTANSDDEIGPGGTYGLIINRLALQPVSEEKRLEILRQRLEERMHQMKDEASLSDTMATKQSSSLLLDIMKPSSSAGSGLQRPISLTQAIRPNDLPESVQAAFGGSPLREGGPVNLSLQMIHRKCLDVKKGGPNSVGDTKQAEASDATTIVKPYEIGGVQIPSLSDETAFDTDAIYFGGDVIKASLAVTDGSEDQGDFSFVVGASCWTPGQLQREIERGCWLPFRGPPTMAMTGMCDHDVFGDLPDGESNEERNCAVRSGAKMTKLSMYPPRPSNSTAMGKQSRKLVERPKMDLWLSIMCALGEGEATLAYAMLDGKHVLDELGDTCDNFDR
ncbi:hypothetical protein ACHAWX_007244 [Stephanocyclus meneghinianus]